MNIRPECLDDDPQDQTCLVKPGMYIDPCVEEEFKDASFCAGPSDQGSCELEQMSARGYCPGDEGHDDERLSVICADPANFTTECYQWRLQEYGDGYWGTDEGWYESSDGEASTVTYELPNAGQDIGVLLLVIILVSLIGYVILKTRPLS